MKRIIALFLVLLMLLPMMFACKKDDESKETNGTVGESEELPVVVEDLGGKEFNVLNVTSELEYGYANLTEENSDTVLSDAVFNRNLVVNERLNATMTVDDTLTTITQAKERILSLSMSGENEYDLYYLNSPHMMQLAVQGHVAEVDNLTDVIDFDDEWWEPEATGNTMINGVGYGFVGQAALHFYDSLYIIAYNTDRAQELDIPNLAEIALDGDWTLEKLKQYTIIGHEDNGPNGTNGIKDEYDRFGMATNMYFISTVLLSAGEEIVEYDSNNYPSFNGFSDRMIEIYEFVRDNFYVSQQSFMANTDKTLITGQPNHHDIFTSGKSLFYAEPVGSLEKLRTVEFDYCVLPSPKWDAEDEYITSVAQHARMFFLPNQTSDFRPIAIYLDNLNYQSMVDVTPTYIEDVVSLQRLNNVLSYNVMQDIILKSEKEVSLLFMYDWASLNTTIQNYACQNKGLGALSISLQRTFAGVVKDTLGEKK